MTRNTTNLLKKFKKERDESFRIIRKINSINPPLSQKYKFAIFEVSFLKIYIAWEKFIENSFVSYARGAKNSKGRNITCFLKPNTTDITYKIINFGQAYSTWSYDKLMKKANVFFKNGEPYAQALRPMSSQLKDIQKIRNRIVHSSEHSEEDFKTLIRSKIRHAPPKITPGEFLGKIESGTNLTFFQYYTDFLGLAAEEIVN